MVMRPYICPWQDSTRAKKQSATLTGLRNPRRSTHTTLKTTPAVAAGIEEKPWDLEQVVEMTAEYMRRKEDAVFEAAFAELK